MSTNNKSVYRKYINYIYTHGMKNIQLLFFWRLDQEKWREAIIAMIKYFGDIQITSLPFVFHIFGKWSYEKKILQLAEQYPQHIIYYGFQPIDTVKKTAAQCDYCLMPSLFLETFGLSAVNALARWLPVIWYQQWGMQPFVLDTYNLWSNPGSPDVQLIAMVERLLAKWNHNDSKKCRDIAKKYSKKERIHNFNTLAQSAWKKILLVTDFVSKIGGIETYIHDVAALLTEQWYTVHILGSSWGKTKSSRIFSMLLSTCNVFFAWKLRKKIQDFQPDIIWCHSVLRHIGWLGLSAINKSSAHKRIMYHDLWYFHPFPHTVTHPSQMPASLKWHDFSASIKNPIMKFFVWGKWLLLKKIQKQLTQFDHHLVPSQFMKKYIEYNYAKNDVTILSHFIQK